ncbi:MAG: glycosyltransferase family 2 protein [Anaerolineae bacterium]|nr:glycosyltransferase family 2 protein [Anaerolineae bacterium]
MPDNRPTVTIIMPIRNEADFIARSLGAVLAQDYPARLIDILIADGMSSDGTREIIGEIAAAQPDRRLVLIDNPGQIVPTGLNTSLKYAQGQIIIRVDGHCEIAPDYVSNCVAHLNNGEADAVGGSIKTTAETTVGQVIAAAMSSPFGVGGSAFRTVSNKTMLVDTVPFPAYTRAVIERTGPFDEELVRNQDDEYNYRLRKLGGTILLAANIHSTYTSRSTLLSLWRQYYQYGFYKVRVIQKHPMQARPRQFAPLLFVLSLISGIVLAVFVPVVRILLIALIVAYILANLTASLITAQRADWRLLPLLPVAFVILHISYGLGFLIGLIRFASHWWDR